ncbi:hypothetical protein PGQ11_007699 [Apiospora arundinis]|uniref:Uncharacterized protein n=1 Tax=Apiospora arundinis TaxID=335852 RepID=A0ABR2IWC2_9PEZI
MPSSIEIVSAAQSVDAGFNKIDGLFYGPIQERDRLIETIANPTLIDGSIKFDVTWKPVWVDAHDIMGEGVPYLYETLYLRSGFQKDTRWSRHLKLDETKTAEILPVRVLQSEVVEADGCTKDCFLVSFTDSKVDLQNLNDHWLEYGQNLAMSQLGKAVLLPDEVGGHALDAEAQKLTATNTCHSADTRNSRLALADHYPSYPERSPPAREKSHRSSSIILVGPPFPMGVEQPGTRPLVQKGLDLHRDDGDKNDSLPRQGKASSYGDQEISPISDYRLAGIGGTEATANQCHENGNNHDNGIKLETLFDHRAGAKFGFYEYEKLTGVHIGNKGTLATVEVHWRPSSVSLQDLPRTALPEVREIFLKMYSETEWYEQMELLQKRGRPSKRRRFGVS